MKRKNRENKVFLIVALILCITVGYAALTTTLNITGNSEIKNAKWDIHFTNLKVDDTSVDATTSATIDSNKTTVNYAVNLVKPGDSYSFTVDVVNEGTIDGMISTVTNAGLTAEQQKYVEYSITYANGKELKEKDGLKAGATRRVKVNVKYKEDINPEDLPQANQTLNLTFTVKYVQADETAIFPPMPIMKAYTSSSTDDYHNSKYKNKITKIVTKTNIDVPETAIEQWDVSEAGDGSIVAYIEDDGSSNGTYQVTIGGDGAKISANENSSCLFLMFSILKEIDLSNFDTSKVTDMHELFAGCRSLTAIDLSKFDTSKVTNMYAMFASCNSLTTIDLSKIDISNVTNMSSMFAGCGLTGIDLSNRDLSKVTTLNAMFGGCQGLTSVDFSNTNLSSVTNIVNIFGACTGLKTVNLSNTNLSSVTDMSNMFGGCQGLTSVDLSNADLSKVTTLNGMFGGCKSLTILNSSGIDTSNLTNMTQMFSGCGSLTDLDLSAFDTSNVTNMNSMFAGCSNLTSLDLSSFDTSNVTDMGSMFGGCSKLTTTITMRSSQVTSHNGIFGGAATDASAKITLNYTRETSDLVDKMIAAHSATSNIVKGSLVS